MDEVIRDFLIESHEGLDQLDKALLSLEQDPTDSETLNEVFRTTHTIKGTCGFFGFSRLESVAHVGESLLVLLRDKKLSAQSGNRHRLACHGGRLPGDPLED